MKSKREWERERCTSNYSSKVKLKVKSSCWLSWVVTWDPKPEPRLVNKPLKSPRKKNTKNKDLVNFLASWVELRIVDPRRRRLPEIASIASIHDCIKLLRARERRPCQHQLWVILITHLPLTCLPHAETETGSLLRATCGGLAWFWLKPIEPPSWCASFSCRVGEDNQTFFFFFALTLISRDAEKIAELYRSWLMLVDFFFNSVSV